MTEWCCKPDCPGRSPACHDQCEKYRDKVNRGDYEKEGWMAHKGQRSRRRK